MASDSLGAPTPENMGMSETARLQVSSNTVGRDQYVAGGNIVIVRQAISLLTTHEVDQADILADSLFVEPSCYRNALQRLNPSTSEFSPIVVLRGPESSGRRTTALQLIMNSMQSSAPIYELFPDWEEADASMIPGEPRSGYVLNLRGVDRPLPSEFYEGLQSYSRNARINGTRLIIITSETTWAVSGVSHQGFSVIPYIPPSAEDIARLLLEKNPDEKISIKALWLDDDNASSVFKDLLSTQARPYDGVRLADIIRRAKDPSDGNAKDEFLGWREQLNLWFDGQDDRLENRVLQLSVSFLDKAPMKTVMDAYDKLRASLGLVRPPGGPLAGPSSETRCKNAGIEVLDNGTVSLTSIKHDIDAAIIRHVWRTRPQMIPILSDWISHISGPDGVASQQRDKIAESMVKIAETEGGDATLSLINDWLENGKAGYASLAVRTLDRLALHPTVGSQVRQQLLTWADTKTKPLKQQAVARVCTTNFGQELPHRALTRLRHILDTTDDDDTFDLAIGALRELSKADNFSLIEQVFGSIVAWLKDGGDATGVRSYLALLDVSRENPKGGLGGTPLTFVQDVLDSTRGSAKGVQELVSAGWLELWNRTATKDRAADMLLSRWVDLAETGELPQHAVFDIVIKVITHDPVNSAAATRAIMPGKSQLRTELFEAYVKSLWGVASAKGHEVQADDTNYTTSETQEDSPNSSVGE